MNEKSDNKIIHEMISTEKSYNQSLTRLEKVLTLQPSTAITPLLSDLKAQILVLKGISDQLIANVERSLSIERTDNELAKLTLQRTQLLKAFYTAYKPFAQIYNRYLSEVKIAPNAFATLDATLKSDSNKLRFADHLIVPIQRGPRYALLVNTLLKSDGVLDERLKDELVKIEGLIKDNLDTINSALAIPHAPAQGYKIGDLSRALYARFFSGEGAAAAPSADYKPYQFGDYTRALVERLMASDTEEKRSEVNIEFNH